MLRLGKIMEDEELFMIDNEVYDRQVSTYRRLRATIDASYPEGSFVAIRDDQVIAVAKDFSGLRGLLESRGIDPQSTLIAKAGDDMPDYVTIFI